MTTILDIDKLHSLDVLEIYIHRCIADTANPKDMFILGKNFVYSFNLIKTYLYDPSSLSTSELESIELYLILYKKCNISEEILKMSKEDLLDKMDIQYYKIEDNTQVLNDGK